MFPHLLSTPLHTVSRILIPSHVTGRTEKDRPRAEADDNNKDYLYRMYEEILDDIIMLEEKTGTNDAKKLSFIVV